MQGANGCEGSEPPLAWHSKVEFGFEEVNPKLAVVWLVVLPWAGPDVIEVVGGTVAPVESTVQLRVAGLPTLPAPSVARTWKLWAPSDSPL